VSVIHLFYFILSYGYVHLFVYSFCVITFQCLIYRVYLSIGVASVMDFTCVVRPVYVISKGSTLCIIIVDADPVYSLADSIEPGRQYRAWPTVAPPSGANQESLLIRTGRCYAAIAAR